MSKLGRRTFLKQTAASLAALSLSPDEFFAQESQWTTRLVISMNPPRMPYDQLPQRYLDIDEDHPIETLCNRPNIPPAGPASRKGR